MKKRWVPLSGERYYLVDYDDLSVGFNICEYAHHDYKCLDTGNCFKTKRQALLAARLVKKALKQAQNSLERR